METSPDFHELYAEFGMAAEKAQVLEVEAGNVRLAFLTMMMKPKEKPTPEMTAFFRQIVEGTNRQNLGKLLRVVKSLGSYSDSMLATIDTALKRRNYLIHRFFPAHNFAIFSIEGRANMIRELREIRDTLNEAIAMLSGVTETLLAVWGHEGVSEEIHQKLIAKAKRLKL